MRVPEAVGREDGAGRVDHDHPQPQEDQDHQEQPVVGAHLARHGSGLREGPDLLGEHLAPVLVVAEHVEGRARGREEDDVARRGQRRRPAHRRRAWTRPSSTRVTARSAGPIVARPSPIRTAALTRPAPRPASGSKCWPLSRPPAISTIGSSNAARAFSVASTLVPFESLKKRDAVPVARPARAGAGRPGSRGSPSGAARAARRARRRTPSRRATFSRLWAPRRKISPTGQTGVVPTPPKRSVTQPSRTHAPSTTGSRRLNQRRRAPTREAERGGARVVGVQDRPVLGALAPEDARLGVGVRGRGSRADRGGPASGSAPPRRAAGSVRPSRAGSSRPPRRPAVGREPRAPRPRAAGRCCRRRDRPAGLRRGARRSAPSSWSCRSFR